MQPWHPSLVDPVVCPPGLVVNLAGGTNPEQSYSYLAVDGACVPPGWLTSDGSSSNDSILCCCAGTTLRSVQETPRPLYCFHSWCGVYCNRNWMFSKGMPVSGLATIRGWHCMRTSRVFFSLPSWEGGSLRSQTL